MSFQFPEGFLFGVATAAHQVEGGNTNSDYWLYEHVAGSEFVEPSGQSIDHYHRYVADIELIASLGFNCFRFSIEWARIEPAEGRFSRSALDHYRQVLDACHKVNIAPVVTLHHFSSPQWFIAAGGWEAEAAADRFARYCQRVARELGDRMQIVCTVNEANSGVLNVVTGLFGNLNHRKHAAWVAESARRLGVSPDNFSPWNFAGTSGAAENIISAHRKAVEAMKTERPQLQVGLTVAMSDFQARTGGEERTARVRSQVEDRFLDACGDDDFVGVQAYTRVLIGPDGVLPPDEGAELTQMGYEFWPEALGVSIERASQRTDLPVLVSENGIGTEDDSRRIAYVSRALAGVADCLRNGIDVRSYICWSAFDNYEWEFGYGPKFGLVAVDRSTQRRIPKPSAHWLGAIARSRTLEAPERE